MSSLLFHVASSNGRIRILHNLPSVKWRPVSR